MKRRPFEMLSVVVTLAILLAGCDRSLSETAGGPGSSAQSQAELDQQPDRLDATLLAAREYIIRAQSPDGAWRSDVYAAFKEGDALTPLVLNALIQAPGGPHSQVAIEKGRRYLAKMVGADGTIALPESGLTYPVYTAAGAVIALAGQPGFEKAESAWLKELRAKQLVETLGWQSDDPFYGGWSYAKSPPRKPAAGEPLGPLAQPNLSATVFALEALRAAGVSSSDPAVQKALSFVKRCQNFSETQTAGEIFDDGGFYFIQDDSARNKAGVAGTDKAGRVRFASYGSATADGLRSLLLCGIDDARAVAARRWLDVHFSPKRHPGDYARNREAARQALYFYYCHSLARAFREVSTKSDKTSSWAAALADELQNQQQADGSWSNVVVDVREDDPLVATSLALMALGDCRQALGRVSR